MRALLCGILALPCAGCLYHRASIDASGADPAAGRSSVGSTVRDGAPAETRSGPLPFEIPASWVLRDADSRLCAAHTVLRSPLPWWQRFPVDLAVDLWPGRVEVDAVATLVPQPITPRSVADITAEARAYGYAQ
jgi:hypothetical protein